MLYRPGKDAQGRLRAEDVVFADAKPARTRRAGQPRRGRFSIAFALLFIAAVGVSSATTALPWQVPAAYAVMSIVIFLLYARDKRAAKRGRWRTPENTLHVMALIGGWPGALFAQQSLRHKSKKTGLRIVLWLTVLLNIAALVWLHTPVGRVELNRAIADISTIGTTVLDKWSDQSR